MFRDRDLFNQSIDAIVFGILFKLLSAFHIGVSLTGGVFTGLFVGVAYLIILEGFSFLRELLFPRLLEASGEWKILLYFARLRFNSVVVLFITLVSLVVTALLLSSLSLTGFFGTLFVAFVLYVSRNVVRRIWLRTGYKWLLALAVWLQALNQKD